MSIKTKDIIKILPFDKEFKTKLLDEFDSFSPDQKAAVGQILWRTYGQLFKIKRDHNLQLAFFKAKNGQEELNEEFYKRVLDQTDKEMEEEATKLISETDLAQTREELKEIISKPQTN